VTNRKALGILARVGHHLLENRKRRERAFEGDIVILIFLS
jgi:hypothetical protein